MTRSATPAIITGLFHNMKTKAAVLRNIGGPLIIEELEGPKLEKGQVLVKIFYSGLCRSNVNEINGRKGKEFIPHLTGHEASGEVIDVGDGITKVKTGDYVVCSWIKGAGLNSSGVKYQSDNGIVNAGSAATFCEYAVISENRLVKIPKGINPEVASLLGCAVPTGAGIIDSNAMGFTHKLAVFGIGGIGVSALMRAAGRGVECIAFDVVPWKLNWARENIIVEAIDADNVSCGLTEFYGFFDFAIECSGNKVAMETAFKCLKNSGTAIIAGNLESGEKISIDPYDLVKGKKICGSWGGGCFLDRDIPFYASEYLEGNFPIEKLITKIYPLDNINEGIKDLEAGKLIRGVVKI